MDTHRLVDSVTKWNATASARIHQVLARALDTALAPPAGPVLLEVRDDVAAATPIDSLSDWPLLQAPTRTRAVIGSAVVETDVPSEVVRLIEKARRPVILVGGNCPTDAHTRPALQHASEALRAPVFASPAAMGSLPPEAAWCAGTFMNGNLEADVLGASDLILTVGLDAKDFFNAAWRYAAPVLAVNEQPDTQRFVPTTVQLVGPTRLTLAVLARIRSASDWSATDVANYRATFARPFHLDDGAFTIPSALRLARSLLPPETRVAVDAGFGKPLTSYLWSSTEPDHYLTAHGLSTMGYALPAANALCLTYPDQPVVAFMGDGSLLMRASEISVAAEHQLAPIYVAWLDGALAQIETKQLRQRLRPVGARLPRISSAKVAEAFGGVGLDVDTLAEFGQALADARRAGRPTLIGARVDQSCRAEWYELLRG
jgi:acetolactate synthase-1/2/3 large subunit